MSQAQPDSLQHQTPALRMLVTLGGVAMLSGFLIVLVYQLTKPIIEENQRLAIEQMVFKLVPAASIRRDIELAPGLSVYAAYDEQGRLKGVVARGAAQGYADLVHLLYNYAPDCDCIKGFDILKMAETPGLGDKILTDKAFLANFDYLDARLDGEGKQLANPIVTVKHGKKQEQWQIDAISGATVTSRAVGKAINDSAQRMLPLLQPRLDEIRQIQPGQKPSEQQP
ncbi:MAG: FMN-binding protein [Gammaproteobacteria bacterium]|nr:FMN-binding protein [Gammaproteobacteria bacterium]